MSTASAKIWQMHVFQGDADGWFYFKSFCVPDCLDQSKQNKVRSLPWKPSAVIAALVHGGLGDLPIGGQRPKLMGEIC